MKGFTYRELLNALNNLSEEDLDTTASVYQIEYDELYPVIGAYRSDEIIDQLDLNHFILLV